MSNAAVEMARTISAMMPTQPKKTLLGGESHRQEQLAYNTAKAAAVAAWKFAAHSALGDASSASPAEWIIDHDNHEFIDGVNHLGDLMAMCNPAYPWSGRRPDQL